MSDDKGIVKKIMEKGKETSDDENKMKMIRVTKKTKKKLGEVGNKGDTWEDIVSQLIEAYVGDNDD